MVFKRFLKSTEITEILTKPGKDWSGRERQDVFRWLFEEQQLRYLLHFCFYHLGSLATVEDTEDAWSEFCSLRLNGVIESYDPSKGRQFWNYLLFCLERECKHYKWKIIKEEGRKEPIATPSMTEDEELEIVVMTTDVQDPTSKLEHQDFIRYLNHCLAKLPQNWRKAFQMVILQEMSYEEASSILEERVGTLRVFICRAKQALRSCLAMQGWAS